VHNLTALETLGWTAPFKKHFHLTFQHSQSFISTDQFVALNMNTIPSPLKRNCLAGGCDTGDAFCSHILAANDTVIPRSVLHPAHDEQAAEFWGGFVPEQQRC